MKFRYRHESSLSGGGIQCSNVLWGETGRWPVQNGKFSPEHPIHVYAAQFEMFAWRGYEVSPFPEGDGFILVLKNNQTADQVIHDIEECFEWQHVQGDPPGTAMNR